MTPCLLRLCLVSYQMSFDGGYANLQMPAVIKPDEMQDFEEWFAIILRSVRKRSERWAEEQAPKTPTEE